MLHAALDGADAAIEAALRSNQKKIAAVRRAEGKEPLELASSRFNTPGNKKKRTGRHRSDAEAFRRARKIQRLMQGLCALQVASTLVVTAAADAPILLLFVAIDGFGGAATLSRVQRQHALCTIFNLAYLLGSLGAPVALAASLDASTRLADGSLPPIVVPFAYVASAMLVVSSLLAAAAAAFVLQRPLMLYRYETVAMDEETADFRSFFGLGATDLSHDVELGSPQTLGSPREPGGERGLQPVSEWEGGVPLVFMPVKFKPKPVPPVVRPPRSKGAPSIPTLTPPPPVTVAGALPAGAVSGAACGESGGEDGRQESWLEAAESQAAAAFGMEAGEGEGEEGAALEAGLGGGRGGAAGGPGLQRLVLSDESDSEAESDSAEPGGSALVARAQARMAEAGEDADEVSSPTPNADAGRSEEETISALPPPPSALGVEPGGADRSAEELAGGGGAAAGGSRGVWSSAGARMRGLGALSGATGWSVERLKQMADEAPETAEELFARAKACNAEGKYKRACELIERAYALQPKISTALSAANLRLKLGDYAKAVAAYKHVIAAASAVEGARPSAAELAMARSRLREAEAALRSSRVNVELLTPSAEHRRGGAPPVPLASYAQQLEELMEELFSESASLYAEHGVALGDGIKEMVRHLRARRVVAAGQVLKPIEKLVTRACLAQRDEQERAWLTALRSVLNGLRQRSQQVATALRELEEESHQHAPAAAPSPASSPAPSAVPSSSTPSAAEDEPPTASAATPDSSASASATNTPSNDVSAASPTACAPAGCTQASAPASTAPATATPVLPASSGWRLAGESAGVRTDWRPAEGGDGALWIRLGGELSGARLTHALAVAYEVDLWPRWLPLCALAEAVQAPEPMERIVWVQFDLPMLKRGALLHWSLIDCLYEHHCLLLLGHSIAESPAAQRPASAAGVPLAEFGAIKVLIEPLSRKRVRMKWLMHVDLRAQSLPQALIPILTKKVAGSLVSNLSREAQKVSREAAREASADGDERGPPSKAALDASAYLRRVEALPDVYTKTEALIDNFFEMVGYDSEEESGERES